MATMKKYIATFWRGNPQLKDGGYEQLFLFIAVAKARCFY